MRDSSATRYIGFIGRGAAPTFQAATVFFGTGHYPRSVAVGDFNGDGRLDLAVANSRSDDVSVLLNDAPTCRGNRRECPGHS